MKLSWFAPSREAAEKAAPTRASSRGGSDPPAAGLRGFVHSFAREASSVVLLATALYSALALASFKADLARPEVTGANWVGPVGTTFAEIAVTAVGVVSWLVPLELVAIALPLLSTDGRPQTTGMGWLRRIGEDIVVVTVGAALVHVAFPGASAFGEMPLGGTMGELAGELMRSLFSAIGSFIIGLTIVALILVGRASFSFIEGTRSFARLMSHVGSKSAGGVQAMVAAWAEARAIEAERTQKQRAPRIVEEDSDAIIAALSDEPDSPAALPRIAPVLEEPEMAITTPADVPTPSPIPVRSRKKAAPKDSPKEEQPKESAKASKVPPPLPPPPPAPIADDLPTPTPAPAVAPPAPKPKRPAKAEEPALKIVDTSSALEVEKGDRLVPAVGEGFRLPLFEFMDPPEGGGLAVDEEQLKATATLLEKTLSDYGVSGKVEEIHPGPTVTTFEVVPAAGTKVSKVASLADDLALGLSKKVRIIAPIPGKNRVGFEIPNVKRSPVNMRELVEDRRFLEMKAPLPCVLGRDIVGAPYFADLASMPHVIVAGATGAGKSVGLNVILVSLLYRRTPEDLRLLMIDPKVVELAPYDGIPHMLLPVVTDMKQAANALRWAVDEMERRYQLFANAGTKNITTYNGFVEKVLRGEAKAPKPPPPQKVNAIAADGTDVEIDPAKDGSDAPPIAKLPSIVIVVDEFADLMMQQGKDVEASVARLAQKARAAGMHVILATQRPSVDVITGMIKANFPTRVAFRVAQKVDSRTILDEQGAEHLLGRGDMLVKMNGTNDVRRVQCPFISEEETQKVTDFLRLQGKPVYDENILKPRDEDGGEMPEDDAESDPMYDQAVRIVAETRRCSTSWLQRKLGIGYNRAAKLVESMERRGLVGPANGAKDREVLIEPI
ncbi:MAG: cell division protein FtsK [Polyangiaceae bacterium]|nr:cell division protein FtsK [Polyangiaceae bacterium]